jgi:hypothetical protein
MGHAERLVSHAGPAGIRDDSDVVLLAAPELLDKEKIGCRRGHGVEGSGPAAVTVNVRVDVRREQSHYETLRLSTGQLWQS